MLVTVRIVPGQPPAESEKECSITDKEGLLSSVCFGHLIVQSPVVEETTDEKQSAGKQVQDASHPLAHVHAVDAEESQKGQGNPGDVVVDFSFLVASVRLTIQARYQNQIYKPPDTCKAEREKYIVPEMGLP